MKKAVVLLSGGLDSAVAAYIAREDIGKRGKLYALTFEYGQRHWKEVYCAISIGKALEVATHSLPASGLAHFANGSSLVNRRYDIPSEGLSDGIPNTWVPQRNSVFLAYAFACAEVVGADWIYTGFNIKDYSGYPDCRPEFVEAIEKALNLASKEFVEVGKGRSIETPLMYKTKAEIVQKGLSLEVPFKLTTSCYEGGEKACGKCDSCRIRLEAFAKVGVPDPIEYEV